MRFFTTVFSGDRQVRGRHGATPSLGHPQSGSHPQRYAVSGLDVYADDAPVPQNADHDPHSDFSHRDDTAEEVVVSNPEVFTMFLARVKMPKLRLSLFLSLDR